MKTIQTHLKLKTVSALGAVLLLGAAVAQAQMGSGWTQQSYSERLEYHHSGGPTIETISPAPSGFADGYIAYTNSGGTRYFWFKNTTAGRVEIRVNNDYTSGTHQFEGYLTFYQPSSMSAGYNHTTCSQDFGAATHAAWKLEVHTNSGGELVGEGVNIMSGVYGQTHRINIIHDMNTARIYVFVDGSELYNQPDQGGTNHYTKFGMYQGGCVTHDSWANVKYFTGGSVSGGGGGLPSGWTDADIGSVGIAGSASYSSGTFTLSGSGSDIWNTADQFNFAYQSVSGDQTVIARVASENGSAPYAKAGVMIRESTADDAREASVLLTPTNGVALEVRSSTGAASINVAGWVRNIEPAEWVKLVRSGNTFTGYYSSDGSSWTQIASTNVSMSSSAIAGLAVTSHDNSSLNMASFDNVSIGAGGSIDTSAEYQLQNEASGLVLNNQGSLTNGSAITQWASVSSDNLRWTFIPTSNGYYQINSVKSGKDAVVQSASTSQGAGIIQWDFGSSGDDQWLPVQNSDGSYTFYNLNSGLVLEDPASSTDDHTQMDQWGHNGGDNQKWQLIKQ